MSVRELAGTQMRLSDLLRSKVVDSEGQEVGQVHDARFIKDGPVQGAFGPGYRLQGLVVGKGSLGARLGFDRASVTGPWLLKQIFRRLHANARFVDWAAIDAIQEGKVRLNVPAADLRPVEALSA
jgi:sporulation protein YlmC with PRC-barrel domain